MAIYGALDDIVKQKIFKGRIQEGLRYLSGLKDDSLRNKASGYLKKTVIRGKYIYAVHQVYKTRPFEQARFETHRAYIDLQYIRAGRELIYTASADGLRRVSAYDAVNDIEFFGFRNASTLLMGQGMLAIFFPSDAHAPAISSDKPCVVKKTVVKVLV